MGTGPILVVDNGTHYLSELRRALTLIGVPHLVHDAQHQLAPGELAGAWGIILAGGQAHLHTPVAPAEVSLSLHLIEHADVPILGLCLGCQLVAWAYGSTIAPLVEPVDRPAEIEVVADDPLFAGIPSHTPMVMSHEDGIADAGLCIATLARSEFGEYEAIRHRRHPQYGVQFHPEVSGDMGRRLLANFAAICGVDSVLGAHAV
jgi:GMP synthase-like glutamine amidotransferase